MMMISGPQRLSSPTIAIGRGNGDYPKPQSAIVITMGNLNGIPFGMIVISHALSLYPLSTFPANAEPHVVW